MLLYWTSSLFRGFLELFVSTMALSKDSVANTKDKQLVEFLSFTAIVFHQWKCRGSKLGLFNYLPVERQDSDTVAGL